MKKVVLIFMMNILIPFSVSAGIVESTTVKRLMLDHNYNGKLFIQLHTAQDQKISCHTNPSWEYVLDIGNPLGESMYAMLLSAYAAKSTIRVVGAENCNVFTNVETLRRIELK